MLSILEYRLKWKEDNVGNFQRWDKPEFLGDSKIVWSNEFEFEPFLYIPNDKIEGVLFMDTVHKDYFILKNMKDEKYEFRDECF